MDNLFFKNPFASQNRVEPKNDGIKSLKTPFSDEYLNHREQYIESNIKR